MYIIFPFAAYKPQRALIMANEASSKKHLLITLSMIATGAGKPNQYNTTAWSIMITSHTSKRRYEIVPILKGMIYYAVTKISDRLIFSNLDAFFFTCTGSSSYRHCLFLHPWVKLGTINDVRKPLQLAYFINAILQAVGCSYKCFFFSAAQ